MSESRLSAGYKSNIKPSWNWIHLAIMGRRQIQ